MAPSNSGFYYNRSLLAVASKQYKEALKDLDSAIKYNRDFMEAYLNRSIIKYELGDKPGACTDAKKAKQLGSDKADEIIGIVCK